MDGWMCRQTDRYQVVISSTKKNNAEQGKELQTSESLKRNEMSREWVKSKSIFMTDFYDRWRTSGKEVGAEHWILIKNCKGMGIEDPEYSVYSLLLLQETLWGSFNT